MSNDNDPYESKGLSSLMNLLNTYEDGSCGTSTALLENQANTNNNVEKRMTSNKRYIWDDEDFLNVGGVLTPSATAKPSPKAAITSDVQNIKIKMKSMQQELKKKTTYVNELKTTLARKKLAKERNCSKLKVEWAEKIKGLTGGFDNVSIVQAIAIQLLQRRLGILIPGTCTHNNNNTFLLVDKEKAMYK